VLASKRSDYRLQNPNPISDPRIEVLVRSYPLGGVVVWETAHAENPRKRVSVVYSRTQIEALTGPPLRSQATLAQLESALAEAGIAYAVVEQHEQNTFARELDNALSAARNS
jgi:hypothetical protein